MKDEGSDQNLRLELEQYIPYEKFIQIQQRLSELRREEEAKLMALAELQKAYLAANSDSQRDAVKETVGKIRELSKIHRQEIRELNQQLLQHMTLEQAKTFSEKLIPH